MLSNVLFILLGAGLVSVGFLVAALAERLREPPATESRTSYRAPRALPPEPKSVLISADCPSVRVLKRTASKIVPSPEGCEDVIAALVAAGYKKAVATEAAWACTLAERATIEGWAAATLRRCSREA